MSGMLGMMDRDRMKKPMMDREDSSVKRAMKSVLKLGRKNRPKMPTIPTRKQFE